MGQQQLLLLVLGAIIIGLAIVIGINIFSDSAAKANEDFVRQDIIYVAGRLEQFYRTPGTLGGGNFSFPSSLSFPDIGLYFNSDGSDAGSTFENPYGTYSLNVEGSMVTINGAGNEAGVSLTYTLAVNLTTKKFIFSETTS